MSNNKYCGTCGWRPIGDCIWWMKNDLAWAVGDQLGDHWPDYYEFPKPKAIATQPSDGEGCPCWKPRQEVER